MNLTNDIFLPTPSTRIADLLIKYQKNLKNNQLKIVNIPTIKITYLQQKIEKEKLKFLEKADIVLFTSQYAVQFFFQWVKKFCLTEILSQKKWIVIGAESAKKLFQEFPQAKNILLPKEATTEGLLTMIRKKKLQTFSYWFACSNLADNQLQELVTTAGGHFFQQVIYTNQFPTENYFLLQNYFAKTTPLWAIFTSPSTFQNLNYALKEKSIIFQKIQIATLGKTTAKFIEKNKFSVVLIKKTMEQIIDSIIQKQSHHA